MPARPRPARGFLCDHKIPGKTRDVSGFYKKQWNNKKWLSGSQLGPLMGNSNLKERQELWTTCCFIPQEDDMNSRGRRRESYIYILCSNPLIGQKGSGLRISGFQRYSRAQFRVWGRFREEQQRRRSWQETQQFIEFMKKRRALCRRKAQPSYLLNLLLVSQAKSKKQTVTEVIFIPSERLSAAKTLDFAMTYCI